MYRIVKYETKFIFYEFEVLHMLSNYILLDENDHVFYINFYAVILNKLLSIPVEYSWCYCVASLTPEGDIVFDETFYWNLIVLIISVNELSSNLRRLIIYLENVYSQG